MKPPDVWEAMTTGLLPRHVECLMKPPDIWRGYDNSPKHVELMVTDEAP